MSKRSFSALRGIGTLGVFTTAFMACAGHAASVEDATTGAASALTAGVPKRDWLRLETLSAVTQTTPAPQQQPQPGPSCQGGPPAMFAVMTTKIMSDANGVIDGVLGVVGQITQGPPAVLEPGHAVWGPLGIHPNAPSVYRLDVQQLAPTVFRFQLSGRPMAGDESTWRGMFQGQVAAPDPGHRVGDIAVDFGVIHALDPNSDPVTGGVAIHFVNAPDARGIDESFSGIAGHGAPNPNDAHYAYNEGQDGRRFDFVTRTDFDHDGTLDELLHIQSRWVPPGAGKASVVISGGSLGPKVVAAVECWNPALGTVFYADDINANPPAGDAACCVP